MEEGKKPYILIVYHDPPLYTIILEVRVCAPRELLGVQRYAPASTTGYRVARRYRLGPDEEQPGYIRRFSSSSGTLRQIKRK